MKNIKYILISFLLLVCIPYSVLAYDCVLTGSGDSCDKYGPTGEKKDCYGNSVVSCSRWGQQTHNSGKTAAGSCDAWNPVTNDCIHWSIGGDLYDWYNNYTFKLLSNGQCSYVTINNYSIKYWNQWVSKRGSYGPWKNRQVSKENISADSCIAFEGEDPVIIGGVTYYTYKEKWSRCCNDMQDPPADINPYSCYRKDLGNDIYDYQWVSSAPSGYTKVNEITSENECLLLNPNYCQSGNISNNDEFSYKCVNHANTSDITSTVVCQNNSTDFYEVNCNDSYSVSYNPELNNTSMKIKKGLGFDYKINLTSKKRCVGVFHVNEWKDAYDKASKLLSRANKSNDEREKKYYQNKLDEIVKAIDSYNNWQPSGTNSNIEATINLNYKEAKKTNMDHIEKFIVNKVSSKSNKMVNDDSNSASQIANACETINNVRVCPFEILEENVYEMIPTKHYISKNSGEIIKVSYDNNGNIANDLSNAFDGGNKFYISMNAVVGDNYNISTEIIVGNVKIKNSSCSLNIIDGGKELYRIIDEKNPFVNDTRKIGNNWQSDMFDFTKIITKSSQPLYTFNLPKDVIAGIKRSNSNDKEAYLGTCQRKIDMQDEVMRPICAEINKYN